MRISALIFLRYELLHTSALLLARSANLLGCVVRLASCSLNIDTLLTKSIGYREADRAGDIRRNKSLQICRRTHEQLVLHGLAMWILHRNREFQLIFEQFLTQSGRGCKEPILGHHSLLWLHLCAVFTQG